MPVDLDGVGVGVDDFLRRPDLHEVAMTEPGDPVAQVLHRRQAVADEHDGLALVAHLGELLVALALEGLIADRQHLVDQQDVGVDIDGDREPEPDVHARRVVLHRLVDEGADAGEVDDLVEAAPELLLGEPEDGPVEEDVFPAGQLGVESGTQLEQRRHLPVDRHRPHVGTEDLGQAFEHGALARAVLSDQAEGLPLVDLERHVPEGPEIFGDHPPAAHDRGLERVVALLEEAELLGHVDGLDRHRPIGHSSSARPGSSG